MLIKDYGYFETTKMWVRIEISGYEAMIYGDEYLLEALIEQGFKQEKK